MTASSPTISDFALQQLWGEQSSLHATLQKQFFPKEDILTSLLVSPAAVSFALLPLSIYASLRSALLTAPSDPT